MLPTLRRRLVLVACAAAARLLAAGAALARAGGAGGDSGGSASGGGSGPGGDLGLLGLAIAALLIGGGWVQAIRQRARRERERGAAARERSRELGADLRDGERPFDADAFLARAERAFRAIQRACSQQELGPVRAFLSDGVQERFEVQLREQRERGFRNPVSRVRVHLAEIVEVRTDEDLETVSVRFTASATDCRVRLETLDEIPGSRRRERFVEVWSFVRSKGAAPQGEQGLMESCCPSCGASIDPGIGWRCDSCSARLRVAPQDWVLAEITQRAEWRARRGDAVPGLKALRARDPGCTAQHLEDRASVLFWRHVESERRASARNLGSVARREHVAARARRLAAGGCTFAGDCAVGSVELQGVLPGVLPQGEGGESWDRALVEVRWEGGLFDREASDPPRDTGRRSVRRSLLVLARRAGTGSDVAHCIASAHCSHCGAPDAGNAEGSCGWCGITLNDGRRGWLLDALHPWHSDEAVALRREIEPPEAEAARRPPRGLGLFAWAVRIAPGEGPLTRRTRIRLGRLARRIGLHPRSARRLLGAGRRGQLEPELPADAEEAGAWLAALVDLARADGPLRGSERRALQRLARRAGLAPGRLPALLASGDR